MPTAKTKNIVRNLAGSITFLQPMYEAIVNSLEANASHIKINLFADGMELPIATNKTIIGFSIEDNGDGFTDANRVSFCEYLSDHKLSLGCKGIGRYTWLKVFDKIHIKSDTGKELVEFEFTQEFDEQTIENVTKFNINKRSAKRSTTISFFNVSKKYAKNKPIADVKLVKQEIEKYLFVKFFLMSEQKKTYNIVINYNDNGCEITNNNIPHIQRETFDIEDEIDIPNKRKHDFCLYYDFTDKKNNKHHVYYCADERVVGHIDGDKKFSKLPENKHILCLLTSPYFDERVSNERSALEIPYKEPTIDSPISLERINSILKTKIDGIILKRFPSIEDNNRKIIDECINENPHLIPYIQKDGSLIKNKADIIKQSTELYLEEKRASREKFAQLLTDSDLDSKDFDDAVSRISDISMRELSQYVVYRQQIIDMLNKLNNENNKQEKALHNLFMKMGNVSYNKENNIFDSNIWLLDDKYMFFSHILSDKQLNIIKQKITNDIQEEITDGRYEPDLVIFYSDSRDCVVIEFKSIGGAANLKMHAFAQINTNLGVIRKEMKNINSIYGYVITKLDERLQRQLESMPGVRKMFSHSKSPVYYSYNDNIDAHIYFMCTESLCGDATTRNKVFLDILKGKYLKN